MCWITSECVTHPFGKRERGDGNIDLSCAGTSCECQTTIGGGVATQVERFELPVPCVDAATAERLLVERCGATMAR